MKRWIVLAAFTLSFLLAIFVSLDYAVNAEVVAQNISDPDILGQIQKAFTHFVQTGQAWALLIGLVLGYMIRNLTSYG
ncbi:hypothetical protein [Mastigocladopsis repens]|uniref:hypothetical protein n=1 Tax=Mastigocladopsis repens TaxID=221287 RepID=UPI0002DE54F1|nr:hypothetical protein [Mastigocladopsis repens]